MALGALPVYCTREDVKGTLDYKETARNNATVDRAIEQGARFIDGGEPGGGFLKRRFYPETATRYFDWPNAQYARPWRLWLGSHDLISLTTLTAGGTTIASSDYFLRPDHGPPYRYIEIDLESTAAFKAGSTHQRAIAATGVWGHSNNTETAGTLAEALDASETAVDVSDSSLIGVGNVIIVESERMLVTDRAMLDTGQNCSTMTASASNEFITGVTAGTISAGETILVDSERMLVVDVSGTTLTVKRAFDGTTLAAHTSGADIYAPRTLTVIRGALGSTAATHSTSTAITKHMVPSLVRELNVAEALNTIQAGSRGYAHLLRLNEGERKLGLSPLNDIRERAYWAYARTARKAAI